MNQEMLTPLDYESRRIQWTRDTGGFMPSAQEMILRSSDALEKVKFFSVGWAEDFMREYGLRDNWTVDQDVQIEESFEGHSVVAKMVLQSSDGTPAPRSVFSMSKDGPSVVFVGSASPTRDDNDRTPQLRGGMLSLKYGADPETGYRNPDPDDGAMVLYKSWVVEEMDRMGIEIPWEAPEDQDRLPVEE